MLKLSLFIAFWIGSIPTAYLIGKYLKNTDIREHGSGNVGATNAYRVFGKKIGLLVLALDLAKGFLPSFIFSRLLTTPNPDAWFVMVIGLAAILGHIFSPFLRFKGGKGIATGAGVVCAAHPVLFGCVLLIWTSTFLIWHTVSLSSLIAVFSLIPCGYFLGLGLNMFIVSGIFFILAAWTHRLNITRLLQGNEKRLF